MARIVDITSDVGAYGTRLLAELGHDVIRVEPPEGDALRRQGPSMGRTDPQLSARPVDIEAGAFHQYWNAGKRSVALDLQTDEGRCRLIALVRGCDALVASLPLPLDEPSLLVANPNLLLVRLDDGPPEICAYARSGLMAITGDPSRSPVLMGGHVPLAAIGTSLAIATASALLVQQATGQGQIVDVSAQQCLNMLCEQVLIEYLAAGEIMQRRGPRGGITAVAGALHCRDGYWMVCTPPDRKGWKNFTEMVQIPELLQDESLSEEASRRVKKDFILDAVAAWSADFGANDLVERAQGYHIPATPVASPADLVRDPQLLARGFLQEIDHPLFGRVNFPVGAIATLFGTRLASAPTLGQHNAEVLGELARSDLEGGRSSKEGAP